MVIMKLLMMVMSLSATRHFRVFGGRPPFQHAHTSLDFANDVMEVPVH